VSALPMLGLGLLVMLGMMFLRKRLGYGDLRVTGRATRSSASP